MTDEERAAFIEQLRDMFDAMPDKPDCSDPVIAGKVLEELMIKLGKDPWNDDENTCRISICAYCGQVFDWDYGFEIIDDDCDELIERFNQWGDAKYTRFDFMRYIKGREYCGTYGCIFSDLERQKQRQRQEYKTFLAKGGAA